MAEVIAAVSAAASFVQLVSLSGDVLSAGYGYLAKVSNAPNELRTLLLETALLDSLLNRMQALAIDNGNATSRDALTSMKLVGAFDRCDELLKVVSKSIKICDQIPGQDKRNTGRRLIWPFKERETKTTMKNLADLRALISDALVVDSAASLERIERSGKLLERSVADLQMSTSEMTNRNERETIYMWLCPTISPVENNYHMALKTRQSGTGTWLIESTVFKKWLGTSQDILWIHGLPGSGKTVLSSTIIEHLLSLNRNQSFGLVYFFCDHRSDEKQTFDSFLMTAVRQLIEQDPTSYDSIQAHVPSKTPKSHLQAPDYPAILRTLSTHFGCIHIVVDALDESSDEEAFVRGLQDILRERHNSNSFRILITSRHSLKMERLLSPMALYPLSLNERAGLDIIKFITSEIGNRVRSRKLKLRNPALASHIENILTSRKDTLFLQAKIQLDYLCSFKTDNAIKTTLMNLPNGLEDTYTRIFERILAEFPNNVQEIKVLLQWLVQSVCLLSPDQLAEAVAVQPGDTHLDHDKIYSDPEDLIEMLSSLVEIDRGHQPPLVSFAHLSVEEYLVSTGILASPARVFHIDPLAAELSLAQTCLRYVSFLDFEEPISGVLSQKDPRVQKRMDAFKLLEYAARFWPDHLRNAELSLDIFREKIEPNLLWFLQPGVHGNNYSSWLQLFHFHCHSDDDCSRQPPFYHTIVFRISVIVEKLLPEYSDVDIYFENGWTPLTAAATIGRLRIVEKLLKLGAKVDLPASAEFHRETTALHRAVESGSEDMVRLLLNAGASPDVRRSSQATPFCEAASRGSISILRMLHEAGSDVNARAEDGWTALHAAVERGHADIVQLLVSWGADPSIKTSRLAPSRKASLNAFQMFQEIGREAKALQFLDAALPGNERPSPSRDDITSSVGRPQKEFECHEPGCRYATVRWAELRRHLMTRHPGDGAAVASDYQSYCVDSNTRYRNVMDLQSTQSDNENCAAEGSHTEST